MKNIKLLLIGLAAACALSGCGESSNDNPAPEPGGGQGSVTGEWHMISWSTLASADIYLSFSDTNDSFELYQRLYTPGYVHLNGTYSHNDQTLSGKYSSGKSWGSSYAVSFNSDGTIMTLTSITSPGDISVYAKAAIPAEIISDSQEESALQSRTEDTPRFL